MIEKSGKWKRAHLGNQGRTRSLRLDKSPTKASLRPISRFSQRTLGIQTLKQAELRNGHDVRFFIIQRTPFWFEHEIWAKTLIKKVFTPLRCYTSPYSFYIEFSDIREIGGFFVCLCLIEALLVANIKMG